MGTVLALDGSVSHQTPLYGLPVPPPVPGRYVPTFDGNGRYRLPNPETGKPTSYTRASTVAKTLEDTYMLDKWAKRMMLLGIHRDEKLRQDLAAIIDGGGLGFDPDADPDHPRTAGQLVTDLRTPLNILSDDAQAAAGAGYAAEFGTAVHAWCEWYDLGYCHINDVPAMFREHVVAHRRILAESGLRCDRYWTERIVLNTQYGIAGTLDRLFWTHTDQLYLGDIKTSKGMDYSWLYFAIQLAIYHGAQYVLSLDGAAWEPMPALDPTTALISHLPSINAQASRMVPLDMEFGAKALHVAMTVRRLRSKADKYAQPVHYDSDALTARVKRWHQARFAIEMSRYPSEMAALWEHYQDIWTDDLTELGREVIRLADESERS